MGLYHSTGGTSCGLCPLAAAQELLLLGWCWRSFPGEEFLSGRAKQPLRTLCLPTQSFVSFPEMPRAPSELSLAIAVLGSFFWGLLFPFWPFCNEVVKGGCSGIADVSMCSDCCFEKNELWWWWALMFQKSGINWNSPEIGWNCHAHWNYQWDYPVHCLCTHRNPALYTVVFDINSFLYKWAYLLSYIHYYIYFFDKPTFSLFFSSRVTDCSLKVEELSMMTTPSMQTCTLKMDL